MKQAAWVVAGLLVAVLAVWWLRRDDGGTAAPAAAVRADAPRAAPAPATTNRNAPTTGVDATAQPTQPARFVVAFRLDPNVTRGLYLGNRWVTPPTFAFAQPGDRYVVHARVQSNDDDAASVPAQWATTDPEMIAITPEDDGAVTIAIDRPGTAELRVSAGGESKILQVAARKHADAMEVEFRQ